MRCALLIILALLLLNSCSFAPRSHIPPIQIPLKYKEAGKWIKLDKPVPLKTNAWWSLFHDKKLNELEENLDLYNENIHLAAERFEKAVALAQIARSYKYPSINLFGNPVRQKYSTTSASLPVSARTTYNNYLLSPFFIYEIDVWQRVHNALVASEHLALASKYDLATVRLSMEAELAKDYFELQAFNKAQQILDQNVKTYARAYKLRKQRYKGGADSAIEVAEAKAKLENAKLKSEDMQRKRELIQHAIATLIGTFPANVSITPKPFNGKSITPIPPLPSTLLTKRPDIAASIERVQSANASIGVARAAFFPILNLTALLGGYQSSSITKLFSTASSIWAIGAPTNLSIIEPGINQVLFDGFRLQAMLSDTKSNYYLAVHAYRQTVLNALQDVEDHLTNIKKLDRQILTQKAATIARKQSLYQAKQREKKGLTTYLEVAPEENNALNAELALLNLKSKRQLASIGLIKAIGGGWLPT